MMPSMSCGRGASTSSVHSIKLCHAYIQVQLQLCSGSAFGSEFGRLLSSVGVKGASIWSPVFMNLCPELK